MLPSFHHFFHHYLATAEKTLGKQTLHHVDTWLNRQSRRNTED
jgi:hypothetical protein